MNDNPEQADRNWRFSDDSRKELEECLGPEQSKAFAILFEPLVPHLRPSAEVRRMAEKAACLMKEFVDCVAQDGVEDTLRAGTDVSQPEWEQWKSLASRVGREWQRPSRGRPIDHDREIAGMLVGFAFKYLNFPAARSPEGAFATTCAIVFKALGHSTPYVWEPELLARYDRAGRLFLVQLKGNREFLQMLATTTVPDGLGGQRLAFEHLLEVGPRPKGARFRRK